MKTKLLLISLLCIGLLSCEKDDKRENDKNSSNNQENVNGEEDDNKQEKFDYENVKYPQGAIKGVFSVSDTKKVAFSQGNLQYQASTNTWHFAENQYDYVGIGNQNISNTYSGWIDLFGWGTGDNPTNASENYEDYPTFLDWGVNKISNGGNEKGMWRTLTGDEWNYLFEVRDRASALWGQATINDGFKGLVILPDNWKDTNASFVRGSGNGYDTNKFTFQEWSVMESYGAVFLPAAGFRSGTRLVFVGGGGYYWLSTYYSSRYAYSVCFSSGNLNPLGSVDCYLGHSVRLCSEISSK